MTEVELLDSGWIPIPEEVLSKDRPCCNNCRHFVLGCLKNINQGQYSSDKYLCLEYKRVDESE